MAKKRTWLEKKVSTPKNYGKKTTPKKINVPKNNGKKPNSKNLKKDSKNDGKKTSKSDNKPKIAPQRIPKNEGKKKTTIEPQRIPKNYGKSEKKKTISIAPQRVPKREVEYQKKKQNERPTYFSSGAMRDGFSPVNYAKSIIGTGEDMLNDFFTGIGKIPESVIDNVANALAGAYSKSGQEDKYKQITDFIQRDLNKEVGFGDRISRFFVPLQTVSKTYDIANKILNGGNYENVSLLGEKSDSIVQSAGTLAGQIGLQESGINWMLTMASTSYNSALEEAYQNGATWEDSQRYATISSVAEVLSERISGGIKLGGRTLDEGVKKVLTGKIKNNVARTFAKYGFDAVGEGAEEVVSQLGQNLGKKLSFERDKDWEEVFLSDEARQEYIDSLIGGFVLPMVTNAGRLKTSATTGRDYDSNLSDNERRIAQKETEKRVNEEKRKKAISDEIERRTGEAKNILGDVTEEHKSKIEEDVRKEFDGGKDYTDTELSKRELNKIEDEVLEDLKLGEVDIDTIEEYFEPEKVRRINEINRLLSKENGIIGKTDNKGELLKERQKLRTEIAESMRGKLADDYVLQETYRQYALKDEEFSLGKNETYKYENGETITLDSKKDAITRELEKSFKESGIGNTNKAHTLFKVADRLQRKTGIKVKVLSDQQLKDAGLMDEGKLFNGKFVTKGDSKTLYLSTDATQSLNVVLGHEITHTLEGTDGYNVFTETLKEAAIKSGEYYKLKEKYSSLYDSKDLDSELTAELAGNILFNDRGFIKKMTDEPGIFKKIYDTVSSYAKATVGSKEGRQFEALKLTFEKMFSQSTNGGSIKGIAYSRSDSLESKDVSLLGNDAVVKNSVRTLPEDRQTLVNNLVEAGFNKEQAAKWVDDVYGVASMILADRDRLDFEAHDNQTFVKNNQEYVKTVDASTLCAKRLLYQGTFDAISHRLPDMALTSDMILEIRQMMDEKGYEVPCGACYVESRRRHLGKFAQKWLDEYDGEYKPTLDQVTTTDGLEKLRKEHPQTHDDFIKGMNRLGSANPKVVQLRAEYKGEILKITKGQYEKINRIGGLRLQSFSDFETPHLLDMMQVVTDMATRGFVSQAYTKVPNFALVFGDTNVKINLSLMGKGKGVDENGNLIFDDKEGMDHNEAFRIRDMYSKNVGTIMVGINDEHILACMKDDRIDFIIPFHSSGWGQNELKIMKMDEWKDYEKLQREKWVATGKNCDEDIDPMSYWDYSKTGKENAEIYLQKCADEGRIPVFSNFLVNNGDGTYSLQPDGSTDGYWKMLIDFKMYDNDGVGSPHEAVVPNFNMEEARRVLNEYKGDANKLPVAEDVVDEFVKKYSNDVKEQFSLREDSNGKVLSEGQKEYFKDSKIVDSDGRLKVMYHGTARADRVGYIFDPERATSGPMAFFTDSEEIANNYARDKKDTSIAYDERYDSYFTQFRTIINGKDSPIGELWRTFSKAEKEELIEKAKHITFDEDRENIIYNPDEEYGLGNYDDYTLKTVQGNGITALIQSWLEDGNLYNEESKFLDVLRLAGIENVTYLDPEYRDEKTYNVYMNVTNPVKTSEIDEKFADALEQWLDRVDFDGYGKETSYSDMWDKNNRDPYEWLEDLRRDIESNTTRVWTSIPDAITGFLKEQGYDGIVDEGGKNSGYTHQVVIPFSSEQIKDTANLNPTDNIDIRYSLRTLSDGTKYVESEKNKKSLNQVVVRDYAAELQSEYDTTFNPYNDIKELYSFMDSMDGKLSAEDLQEAENMASGIADDILLNMKASQTLTEEASEILKDLRSAKIALSDNQKSEVANAYDGYGRYIQSLFGSVRISKNGVPLDEQWQYWADAYPNLFDRGTPDSEQPMRLAEVIEQLRNSFEVADLPNKTDIELKILSDFYDYPGMRYDKSEATFADAESSVQRKFKGEEVIDEPLRTGDVIDEEIALTESMLQDNIEKGNITLARALERKLRDLRRERKRSLPFRKEIHKAYVDEIANEFKANGMEFNKVLEDAKDKFTFSSVDNTPQRFIEKTLGYKEGQIFNKMTMSKLGKNEADGIRWLNSITGSNGLLSTLYDKYQIKPASKESAAAQKYAEGRYVNEYGDYVKYGDEELAREFKDSKTQERIRGLATDPSIREFYDNTFDRINESRVRNGYEPIPKRNNYYLHFMEPRDFLARKGFPLAPSKLRDKNLPTDINGMTADNKPGQPYFASAKQRKGIRTTYDILGGIEKYANAAKDQIYHIDDIQRFRAVRNYIADMFGQAKGLDDLDGLKPEEQKERIREVFNGHLSTFAKFLHEEANIIAGKTPLIDRGLEGLLGREAINFMKALNSQVGSNMVGLNVGSSLTNMISVVQAISKSSKVDSIRAFSQMCANTIVKTDDLMEKSDFWVRRQGADKFYMNPWQKAQDLAYTFMTITDNFATEFIIRTKYNEFKRKGYDNPLQKADEWAAKLLADRSLGQMPQLYNSSTLGLITKFQLEVRNQLDSMWYDTVNEANETTNNSLIKTAKITSTVVQLAVFQHLFGKAFEAVAGYNPAFDIVDVLITAFGLGDDDDDKEPMDRIEEAFLELLEDLPYTSTLKGGRIPMASALPVNEFITGQNKYGQDKSRLETIKEAAPYWLMPTGYGQIKKTVKGMKMFDKYNPVPGQYNKSGKLQYPVEDTVMNRIQAGIFGANANKNAREYYDGDHKPLTDKQLQEYQDLNIPISDYWKYRKGLSEAGSKNDDKIKYISSLNFPLEKKAIMMNNLYDSKDEANQWYSTKPAVYSVLGDSYANAVRTINTLKADKDENGNSISGTKKEKVINYLNKSGFDYSEKLIILKSEGYKLSDEESLAIIDYLNQREDVTYEQMEDILKAIGYEVDEEGNVWWD